MIRYRPLRSTLAVGAMVLGGASFAGGVDPVRTVSISGEIVAYVLSHSWFLDAPAGKVSEAPGGKVMVVPFSSSFWIRGEDLLYLRVMCHQGEEYAFREPWFLEPWAAREEKTWEEVALVLRNYTLSIPVTLPDIAPEGLRVEHSFPFRFETEEMDWVLVLRFSPPIPRWASPCGDQGLLAVLEHHRGFTSQVFWVSLESTGETMKPKRLISFCHNGP